MKEGFFIAFCLQVEFHALGHLMTGPASDISEVIQQLLYTELHLMRGC